MNIALWIVQVGLALIFVMSGIEKLTKSRDTMVANDRAWAADFTDGQVRTIGTLEIFAAVGLIAPAALDIVPILVPVAAAGLVALMVAAAITHVRRDEGVLPVNFIFGGLALLVAIGRFGPERFS